MKMESTKVNTKDKGLESTKWNTSYTLGKMLVRHEKYSTIVHKSRGMLTINQTAESNDRFGTELGV